MGCTNSKQSRCSHCKTAYAPMPRSHSMKEPRSGYHVVSLKSTTLGSLKTEASLDRSIHGGHVKGCEVTDNGDQIEGSKDEDDGDKKVPKTWSKMVDEKVPRFVSKTPIRTPPGEPEMINAWELMEGLEDTSPLRPFNHLRSFSFGGVCHRTDQDSFNRPSSVFEEYGIDSPKPMGVQMASNDSNSNLSRYLGIYEQNGQAVRPLNTFHKDPQHLKYCKIEQSDLSPMKKTNEVTEDFKCPSFSKHRVVVYSTSLRGVRKTYEDCCLVRVILKGLAVRVDERDVSMHSGFKEELKELLRGDSLNGVGLKNLNLPRVFLGRKHIGGADEIRKLHEDGRLENVLEFCEKFSEDAIINEQNGIRSIVVCDACGDVRFVPCQACSGSCKIHYEDDQNDDASPGQYVRHVRGKDDGSFGFRRCSDCNENGLIRCPVCFD